MSFYADSEGYMSRDHSRDPHEFTNENSKSPGHRVRFEVPDSQETENSIPTRRTASLYDSAAGRVNTHGFNPKKPFASKYRDTQSSGARDLRPEEILYGHKSKLTKKLNALETESYFAHEKLPADRVLPTSELLTAIHSYTSNFYAHLPEDAEHNFQSMDDSALLAVGILMEELAKEQLGETGDMVLTEEQWTSDEEDDDVKSDPFADSDSEDKKRLRIKNSEEPVRLNRYEQYRRQRKPKKHRLTVGGHGAGMEETHGEESPKKKQKYK